MKTISQMKQAEKLIRDYFNVGGANYRLREEFRKETELTGKKLTSHLNKLSTGSLEGTLREIALLVGLITTTIVEFNIPICNRAEITNYANKHGV